MKHIIIVLLVALSTIPSIAQEKADTNKHMTFKGVPINGTLNDFVIEMKKSGFELIGIEEEAAILKGDFAAYKDCFIGVSTLKQKDLVSNITVIFPDMDTWSALSSNYYTLKELLTQKYGKPVENIEKWDTYSKPRNDRDKMYEVKMDNCKYFAVFETQNGGIKLLIDHDGFLNCFVRLSYFDKINSEIIREKAIDDL